MENYIVYVPVLDGLKPVTVSGATRHLVEEDKQLLTFKRNEKTIAVFREWSHYLLDPQEKGIQETGGGHK